MTGSFSALLLTAAIEPLLKERVIAFAVAHQSWALALVACIGLLKSLPVIAAFVPSTAIFAGLAAIYSAGGGTFAPLWLAAAFGATAGDVICYAAGYRYQHNIANLWPLSKAPLVLAKGQVLFARWGVLSVLGAKFVWGVRPFIPVIAGMYRMPFAIFLAATNLSSLVWAAIGMGAGFGLWQLWH